MLRLGAHESIAGGLHRAIERGVSVGCESLQIWTKNSRQWHAPPLDPEEVAEFKRVRDAHDIRPIVAHASYLINIASPDPALYRQSVEALIVEARRCQELGIPYLVLHPGAHIGSGMDQGHDQAVRALQEVSAALQESRILILLETTAGQGTALGGDLASLAYLLEGAAADNHYGVCFDTCHAFAAGYELRTEEGYQQTMGEFDARIGLDRLRVIHLNDSKYPLGSHRDRHEHIGEGHIGLEGFEHIVADPRLNGLPGILETPKSEDLHEDRENLAKLRALTGVHTPASDT